MKLIGLCGKAGSGKTTAAAYLEMKGFERKPFADPLKRMLHAVGVPEENLWGDRKEEKLEMLCGKSAREAMQLLGTEWGRNLIGKDLWVNLWCESVRGLPRVVVDDVRFTSEAAAIVNMGGVIIQMERPGHLPTIHTTHSSESGIASGLVTYKVVNQRGIEQLTARLDQIIAGVFGITEDEIVELMG